MTKEKRNLNNIISIYSIIYTSSYVYLIDIMLFIFKKKHANFKPLSAMNTSKTGRDPTTHQHKDRGALKRSNKVTKEMKSTA